MDTIIKKCVIVVNEQLPPGILANTAAILGMTLGKEAPECVGEDITDGSGLIHKGITMIPIPILKGDRDLLKRLQNKLHTAEFCDLLVVDFSELAQHSNAYHDYRYKAERLKEEEFSYLGIALYGEKKKVNKLTGSLPLLR